MAGAVLGARTLEADMHVAWAVDFGAVVSSARRGRKPRGLWRTGTGRCAYESGGGQQGRPLVISPDQL